MRALRRARENTFPGRTGEEFDLHPNLIDLAFYAPPGSAGAFVPLAGTMYRIFLSLALVQGVWLSRHMFDARLPATYIWIVTVLGVLLWLRAAWVLGHLWRTAIGLYVSGWRQSK